MTTVFKPIIEFPPDEVWVNQNVQGLWSRVAVVSMWTPLARTRKAWDDKPAVIGMLRTLPGIDLLVRGLLANPQIRVVVIDGTDASADKATSKALLAVWRGESHRTLLGDDIGHPEAADLFRDVELIDAKDIRERGLNDDDIWFNVLWDKAQPEGPTQETPVENRDRPGGAIVLPPPPPKASAPASHGDPGERVAGDTLADVWLPWLPVYEVSAARNAGAQTPAKSAR